MQPEVPRGEPPFDGTAESGAPAPAVGVAPALPTPRVVEAMHEAPAHAEMVDPSGMGGDGLEPPTLCV
jgi:hypothetical protein